MATVILHVSYDMRYLDLGDPYEAYDASLTPSIVTLYWDYSYSDRSVFYGSFQISGNDVSGGIITSIEDYVGGVKQLSASNLNYTVDAYKYYSSRGDSDGFLQDILKFNDSIFGSSGRDVIESFAGNDTILGGAGNDELSGLSGSDLLEGGAGDDKLRGGSGNDTLNGGTGADSMAGGTGNDSYAVGNRNDVVTELSGEGTDTIRSSLTRVLDANVEHLVLTGSISINGTGNGLPNQITGNGAGNVLSGGGGNDTLVGGDGNDTLSGGTGADRLNGGSGADRLVGGSGADRLRGDSGADRLAGGAGNDDLEGGLGSDIFRFDSALSKSTNIDRITDFNVVDDTIHLENAVFDSLTATGTLASGWLRVGAGVTTAADRNDYLIYNSSTGALYYDADGSGSASAPIQFATLGTGLPLAAADIFVT
jgi:Ca2+-binding RTX toxin-like protein